MEKYYYEVRISEGSYINFESDVDCEDDTDSIIEELHKIMREDGDAYNDEINNCISARRTCEEEYLHYANLLKQLNQ